MYVIRSYSGGGMELMEMTKKEYAATQPDRNYAWVDPYTARDYVKRGGHHSTPLYIDMDGKVRYAKDSN